MYTVSVEKEDKREKMKTKYAPIYKDMQVKHLTIICYIVTSKSTSSVNLND